jgi:hypothetical protein
MGDQDAAADFARTDLALGDHVVDCPDGQRPLVSRLDPRVQKPRQWCI